MVWECLTEYDEAKTMAKIRRDAIKEGREIGREIGRKVGEEKLALLLQKLLAQGKNEDIQRISVDKEYRKHLYEEYGLNDLNVI